MKVKYIKLIGAILASMMLLSSCSSVVDKNNAPLTVSPTTLKVSLQTAKPTSEPTMEPQVPDEFANFHECYTWRDAKENCVVTYNDLLSGKLVEYAKKVTKPFPVDAFSLEIHRWDVLNNIMGSSYVFLAKPIGSVDESTQAMLNIDSGFGVNKEVFSDPRSPIGEKLFFWVKSDGTPDLNFDALAVVEKVKNVDGTEGYYTLVQFPIGLQVGEAETVKAYDDMFNNTLYQPPCYDAFYIRRTNWMEVLKDNGNLFLRILDDENTKMLLDQWALTGIVPEELEKSLLLPMPLSNFGGNGLPWSK
jgi:hypothetical protein